MGQHISARINERTSKGMPPFFIELGNELIIVYWGCLILAPVMVLRHKSQLFGEEGAQDGSKELIV